MGAATAAAALLTFIVGLVWHPGFLVWHPGFTALGHVCAVLIGLCCYPLTRVEGAPWNPRSVRALFRRRDAADRTAG